jgi:hypothetical protein
VAARRGVPVAYVPGLVMRRAADLYPGEAKTDRHDAYVLADKAEPGAGRCSGSMPARMSYRPRCGCSTATTSIWPRIRRGWPAACVTR